MAELVCLDPLNSIGELQVYKGMRIAVVLLDFVAQSPFGPEQTAGFQIIVFAFVLFFTWALGVT